MKVSGMAPSLASSGSCRPMPGGLCPFFPGMAGARVTVAAKERTATSRRSLAIGARVSESTISRWAKEGRIPGAVRRPTGRWTYPDLESATDWLTDLLNERTTTSADS
jgi:hypothetical protein